MKKLKKDINEFKKNSIEENKEFVFNFLDQNYSLEDVQKFISEVKNLHNNNGKTYDQETESILSIIIVIKRIEKVFNEIVCHHENDNERWYNVIKNSICIIKNSISNLSDTNKEKIKKYINKLILEKDDYTYQSYLINGLYNNYILDLLNDNTLEQILESTRIKLSAPCYKQQLEGFERSINAISRLKRLSATQEIDINSFLQIKKLISELTIEKNNTAVESLNGYVANILLQKFNNGTPMAIEELKELNEYCEKGIVDIEEEDKKRLDDLLNKKEQAQEENIVRGKVSKLKSFFKSVTKKIVEFKEKNIVRGKVSKLKSFFKSVHKQIVEFKEKHIKEKPQNNSEETPKRTSGPNRNDLPKVEASNWIKNMYDNKYKYGMGNVRRTVEQAKKSGQNIGVGYDMEWLDYGMEENENSNKHR